MEISEGFVKVKGGEVWYRRVKNGGEGIPLLVLHGGPGNSHLPLEALDVLSKHREVIYYDQLGSGFSQRPDHDDLWRLERFVEELGQVRKELALEEVHILGHSWGTTLLSAYLLTRPAGVRSAVFSSSCLSAPRWADDQKRLLKEMPADVQATIERCETEGNTDNKEYKEATQTYYKKHVCRLDPWPEAMEKAFTLGNPDIYLTMWGPSEFCVTGNLKEYDCTPRLHEINVPSLFLCGRHDEATPESTLYFSSLVPDASYHIFEDSSHTPYLEQHEEYISVVSSFLPEAERKA
ncbi:proline iminopeptidase-family hydrolase [Peribacillus deserti]|uniref:Proline iminopeptidase n=1 Tax=Peribacillus deserti TaxID=673318 RepID=A0A2N5M4Y2_9BACI|nr:proline iminopeptidase-family hydrolase [Peribacillus deserti]PLT29426.1 proline iminopeptidase [Peribacillus deserti]